MARHPKRSRDPNQLAKMTVDLASGEAEEPRVARPPKDPAALGRPRQEAGGRTVKVPKGQMTGMLGVYLVAAELTRLGFIVSPTSRSARGADLLVTDQGCRKAWSVQVKTNGRAANFWLVGAHAVSMKSASHVYVFVNLRGESRPEYLVVPSEHVAARTRRSVSDPGSVWYEFRRAERLTDGEGWDLFGDAGFCPDC